MEQQQRRQLMDIGPPPPTIAYHYPAPLHHYPPPPYPPPQYPQPYNPYHTYPQYHAYPPPTGQYVISHYDPSHNMNQQVIDAPPTRVGRIRGRGRGGSKSIFPQKLWRLVNNQQLSPAIKWSDDGLSFFVNENPLANMCLGKENNFFYTKQPKSFIRQLHLYGFRKVNKNQFMHRFFVRGRPDQVRFIKRSYKSTGSTSSDKSEDSTESNSTKGRDNEVAKEGEKKSSTETSVDKPCSSSSSVDQTVKVANQSCDVEKDGAERKCSSCSAREGETLNQLTSQTVDEQQDEQPILQLESQVVDQPGDTFAEPSNAAVALGNNFDMNCPNQIDWYGNNCADNSYSYNGESILNLYDNEGFPNPYDNDNITM